MPLSRSSGSHKLLSSCLIHSHIYTPYFKNQTKKMPVCFKVDPHSHLLVPFLKENEVPHQVMWCLPVHWVLHVRQQDGAHVLCKIQFHSVAAAALCISLAWRISKALWLSHSHQMFLPVQPCGSGLYLPCSYCLKEHKRSLGRAATG